MRGGGWQARVSCADDAHARSASASRRRRAPNRSDWVELARRVEAHGYDCLTMPDHFTDQLAPVPALMTAADATTTLRVGALVLDNDYKHPVVLAKELATIDVLSDGRLEIGIGAGWMSTDYEQSGHPLRLARRAHRPLRGGPRRHQGRDAAPGRSRSRASTTRSPNYDGLPKPVQRPCPPILIGGGGKRVLGIAAREADIVGINGTLHAGRRRPGRLATMTADAVDEKIAIVHAAAGERMDEIELNVRVFLVNVTDDRVGVMEWPVERARRARAFIEQSPVRAHRHPGAADRGHARPARAVGLLLHHRRRRRRRAVRPRRRRARRQVVVTERAPVSANPRSRCGAPA